MRASPVDLIGGYYKSDSLPWSCQDTVNWLPVMAEVEGTRSLKMLETPPGLKPYQQIGTGPIRGMHDCEGLRLVVSGRYLYRITNAGVGVPIGVIPGVGRVSMTHNQFETGYQVLVENGQPGGGYVYNTVDLTFARITDEGYPGSISSDYLDSFLLGVEPFGRFWFHSDLASATSYNTLDRYEAEASPDKIVGLAVSGQEVVVFGQRTTEFFMNVGAATGTFQNRNTGFDRGCASRDTIAKLDNSIFWLGDDGIVYRLNGYAAQPVSTRALDQQLSRYNLAQAFAFVWEDRGHKVYYLTFPDGQTFGYDVVTGLWHRRESFGLDRWRLTHVVEWSGKKYGGDFQTGRIFLIDWDYHLEGSEEIISERVSPALIDNQSRLGIPSAELVFDTGQGPGTVPVPFPSQPGMPTLSGAFPVGYVENSYSYTMPVVGGAQPYIFSILEGSLPSGISLDAGTGTVSGVPLATFASSILIRVTDSNGMWDERQYSLRIYSTLPAFMDGSNAYRLQPDGSYVRYGNNPVGTGGVYLGLSVSRSAKYIAGPVAGALQWAKLNTNGTAYGLLPAPPQPGGTVRKSQFSPDEKFLAVTNATTVFIYKIDNALDTLTLVSSAPAGSEPNSISWRQDSKRIIVGTTPDDGFNRRAVYPVNENGVLGARYSPPTTIASQAADGFDWSPDMQYVAERNNNGLYIWRVTDAAISLSSSHAVSSGRGAYFSKDGATVFAFSSAMSGSRRYPFASGVLGVSQPTLWQNAQVINDSSISSDKSRIVVATTGTPSLPVLLTDGGDLRSDTQQPPTPTSTSSVVRWTTGDSNG